MSVIFEKEKCVKCGICVDNCPEDILVMKADGPAVQYPLECCWCGACEMDCRANAIRVRYTKQTGPVFVKREGR